MKSSNADKTEVGVLVKLADYTKLIFVLAVVLFLTACQQAVKNFVQGGGDSSTGGGSSTNVITTSPSNHLIKISPGSQYSKGTAYEGQISITTRQLKMTGARYDAKLGINQNRTN